MKYLGMLPIVLLFGYVGCFQPALEQDADDGGPDTLEPGPDVPDVPPDVPDTAPDVADTVQPDVPDTVQPDVDLTSCDGRPQGSPCNDGNPCTRDDQCTSQGCEGVPFICDDGLTCTEDRCDGVGGCTYPLSDGACLIEQQCVAVGELSPTGCSLCAVGGGQPAQEGAPCSPIESCRADGVCSAGACSGPVSCLDSNACSIGTCDGVGECEHHPSISGVNVLGLEGVWARVPTGGDVRSRFALWSTGRTAVAMNLSSSEVGGSGVPGWDFATLGTRGAFLVTYAADGALAWYNSIKVTGAQSSEIDAIDARDHLVVAGSASPGADFNGAFTSPNTGPSDQRPFFLSSYGSSGNPTWIQRFDGAVSVIGVVARSSASAEVIVLQDQAPVTMPGPSSAMSFPGVAGSRIVLGIVTDGTGKALAGRRLVRLTRSAEPVVLVGSSGIGHESTVIAVGGVSASLLVGESPVIQVPEFNRVRVVVASFNLNGQATWMREFVASDEVQVRSISSASGGRVLVAVETDAPRISLRSADAFIGDFDAGAATVFAFDAAGGLAGQLTLNSRLQTLSASNGPFDAIIVQNIGALVATTRSIDVPKEWRLPQTGDLVVLRTSATLEPIGIAEIGSFSGGEVTSAFRDSRLYLSQPSSGVVSPLGSVETPLTPLQSAPGRVLFALSITSCE